ncbi:UDP-forming cellulose synthase catalytic subunit [Hydrocarboniphaga sp.]|uniref:UDP-forming cellulose synthase catalytic subunit n=1 Tax=Hydrocarboniphaga sp. TaxID=2033016 RepID=UPI002631755C|nr:UDP-forming cellulose synthase catalytic subunit [Hydrocarboniphaga sp.]
MDRRSLLAWLLALLLLPPAQRRAWPRWLQYAAAWLARALAVTDPARPGVWIEALIFANPALRLPSRAAEWPGALAAALRWTLAPLLRVAVAGPNWITRRLDRVDFVRQGQRIDGLADQLTQRSRWLRAALLPVAAALLLVSASTPVEPMQQFLFLFLCWSTAMLVRRMPGDLPSLILVALSTLVSGRYIWWRLTQTLDVEGTASQVLSAGLVAAECYTWTVMVLGYVQSAWPLRRAPALMPPDISSWPSVDIFIPTYNEPLKVVQPTVLAAQSIDWPADKLKIYLLDDGRRTEFRNFAERAGVEYKIRPDNFHAKAGNLNHALQHSSGDIIAIFDCDHLPTRSFLQMTVGWMLRDRNCAMLQTPHHFFSPDPFERNLHMFRRVPNEGTLFYGLMQDGNDLWNATFFCGSCALIRRGPLMEVGGIAVETVTEDAHTALKLHRLGYGTAYLNLRQAAGLATESLSAHVGQRIRWARGMAQIFRVDNPLFGRGLHALQRLCYFNAMLHFFYGLPRLVFLTAPLAYLFFEIHIITAQAGMLALYALPHLVHAQLANSRLQGRYRHSFWAEAYETVLAWYIARPTLFALIAPKIGKFNVTAKGGLVEREYFDWEIARPFLVLATINLVGLGVGLLRLTVWNHNESGTVLMNLAWTIYNLILLGAAIGVCREARQMRSEHRIPLQVEAELRFEDGHRIQCRTRDGSISGLSIECAVDADFELDTPLTVMLDGGDRMHGFPARVVGCGDGKLGLRFEPLSLDQERKLIQCSFARADAWVSWDDKAAPDRPLSSLREIVSYGIEGYRHFVGTALQALLARWRRVPVIAAGNV